MPVIALPALAGVAAALLALLLLWGIQAFIKALASIIPKGLPLIGDSLHNLILVGATIAAATAQWLMADLIRPVINFILAPVFALVNWLTHLAQWVDTVSHELAWIVTSAIPDAIHRAISTARALVAAVHAYALHLYHLALTALHHAISAVRAYALHLYHVAISALHTAISAVRAYALHLYNVGLHAMHVAVSAARAYALHLYHVAVHDLTASIDAVRHLVRAEISVAEKYADSAVSVAVKALTSEITVATAAVIQVVDVDSVKALGALWPGVLDDIAGLEGVIGLDLPDIGAAVRAIPRAIPLDLTDALTIVGALSIPMLRYMTKCGVPNCRNLSSLGRDLRNLLDDLAGGAFLALLIGLAADPLGTARFLNDEVGPIATDAVNGARNLLGV